jgi:hypothetical protein
MPGGSDATSGGFAGGGVWDGGPIAVGVGGGGDDPAVGGKHTAWFVVQVTPSLSVHVVMPLLAF